jgi:threonine synthase
VKLSCEGCGAEDLPSAENPFPFRCPQATAGDGIDHILVPSKGIDEWMPTSEKNPFLRYRRTLYSYVVANQHGMSDADYVALVERIDSNLHGLVGHGFLVTPYYRDARLSTALGFSNTGGIWVKDETGQVGGSHKARHLMGIMLYLEVVRALGWFVDKPRLGIASCGNAALAAAVVARAADYHLDVYIPVNANPAVVARLIELGAHITRCERRADEVGDPCFLRFMEALDHGTVPFCCQGSACGLNLDGGRTIGFEFATESALDDVIIQVGGGAFMSAVMRAYWGLHEAGVVSKIPRLHTVQTTGAAPLHRAWSRIVSEGKATGDQHGVLNRARVERGSYMWAWEDEPVSIATGILDDETYDWHRIVRGMIESEGSALIASERQLQKATDLVRQVAGVSACVTGSAGLAGLLRLFETAKIGADQRIGLIWSGVRRD